MDLKESYFSEDVHMNPCCPECGYSAVQKRKRNGLWVCGKCGWAGKVPGRKEMKIKSDLPKALKSKDSIDNALKLKISREAIKKLRG